MFPYLDVELVGVKRNLFVIWRKLKNANSIVLLNESVRNLLKQLHIKK